PRLMAGLDRRPGAALLCKKVVGHQTATFTGNGNSMNLSLRTLHLVAGAFFWVFAISLMAPQMAGARTMLQIGDGMTLSFADGD
mgnify:CR=1